MPQRAYYLKEKTAVGYSWQGELPIKTEMILVTMMHSGLSTSEAN